MKSILVIDDDFAMRRGIALMLKGLGYDVREAGDGAQGLHLLDEKSVDLAIVDLFLPGEDGLHVAEEIGHQSPGTKILLLTAHGEHPRAREARRLFQENYLEKSSLSLVLAKKVEELLGTEQSSANGPARRDEM